MSTSSTSFPASDATWLHLTNPTPEELPLIAKETASEWRGPLPVSKFIEESEYLETVPLAKNGGMTHWILVDSRLEPSERQIFCSCETFRKRTLASTKDGEVKDVIVHSVASVFCVPQYRGRGYPKRMMQELDRELRKWQLDGSQCIGSILYSDIGKEYYAKLGWIPQTNNSHVRLRVEPVVRSPMVQEVLAENIPALCKKDEEQLRKLMAKPTQEDQTRVTIIPDVDHIGWHLANEDFACTFLFGEAPKHKGATIGSPGSRAWVIWTRRYYDHPDKENSNNVLYILRLVLEGDSKGGSTLDDDNYLEQTRNLQALLEAAQQEACAWKLDEVQLWDPTPLVRKMLTQMNIEYKILERQKTSIASALWFHEGNDFIGSRPSWLNNEHYAWC